MKLSPFHAIGSAFGALLGGHLADKYGRYSLLLPGFSLFPCKECVS